MRSCFLFEFDIGKGGVCTSFWRGSFFFFFFIWIDTGEKFSKFETMGEKGKGRNDG